MTTLNMNLEYYTGSFLMHTLSHHFHNKHDFGLKSLTDMYPNYVLQSYIVYNIRYIIYRMFHKPAVLAQHDFCDEIFNWVWRKAFFKISKTHNPLKFWSFSAFKKRRFPESDITWTTKRMSWKGTDWKSFYGVHLSWKRFISSISGTKTGLEMNWNLVGQGFNWTLDRNTVFMLL